MRIKTSDLETQTSSTSKSRAHTQTLIWVLNKDDSNCSYASEGIGKILETNMLP